MSTNYIVSIDMQLSGNSEAKVGTLAGKVGNLESVASRAGTALAGMGSQLSDAFTGAVEKVGSVAMGLAKIGVVTGIAAAAYGVMHLNRELESTQISLAAIFNAQGVVGSIGDGMTLAADQMVKMRRDAAALPGEFDDLKRILTTIATPALAAGMNVDQLRAMSAQTMAVGAVMGIQSDQTAREMAMLLEGRAGGHNVLGMRLGFMGDKAHALHEATPEKRVDMVNKELKKYEPAIDEFGKAFDGVWTDSMSKVKEAWGDATRPLFEVIKTHLSHFNDWFLANRDKVADWTARIGDFLAMGFQKGVDLIQDWGPAVAAFATNAYHEIARIWESIEPIVARVGESIQRFLKDPGSLGKIEHILELYAAVKVGGAASSFLGPLAGALSLGSKLGGAGAAAGAAEGGAALGGGALAAGGLVTAAVGTAIYGAVHVIEDSGDIMHAVAVEKWGSIKSNWTDTQHHLSVSMTELSQTANSTIVPAFTKVSDLIGTMLLNSLNDAASALNSFLLGIERVSGYAAYYMAKNHGLLDDVEGTSKRADDDYGMSLVAISTSTAGINAKLQKQAAPHHPGNPGINIAKVEISVTSNNEPSRVAALVMDKLSNLRKHPRASPDVTNFASAMR